MFFKLIFFFQTQMSAKYYRFSVRLAPYLARSSIWGMNPFLRAPLAHPEIVRDSGGPGKPWLSFSDRYVRSWSSGTPVLCPRKRGLCFPQTKANSCVLWIWFHPTVHSILPQMAFFFLKKKRKRSSLSPRAGDEVSVNVLLLCSAQLSSAADRAHAAPPAHRLVHPLDSASGCYHYSETALANPLTHQCLHLQTQTFLFHLPTCLVAEAQTLSSSSLQATPVCFCYLHW